MNALYYLIINLLLIYSVYVQYVKIYIYTYLQYQVYMLGLVY